MIRTEGLRCLVVGGGQVGERKVRDCLGSGLKVVLVAPRVTEGLQVLHREGSIQWCAREFVPGDLEGVRLVCVAAPPQTGVQVAALARERGILVNVADRPELSDFVFPAILRQGPVVVAVSTGGASPALAARIRDRLAEVVGPETGEWARMLAGFRERVLARWPGGRERQLILRQASQLDGEAMLARGDRQTLEDVLDGLLAGGGRGEAGEVADGPAGR